MSSKYFRKAFNLGGRALFNELINLKTYIIFIFITWRFQKLVLLQTIRQSAHGLPKWVISILICCFQDRTPHQIILESRQLPVYWFGVIIFNFLVSRHTTFKHMPTCIKLASRSECKYRLNINENKWSKYSLPSYLFENLKRLKYHKRYRYIRVSVAKKMRKSVTYW